MTKLKRMINIEEIERLADLDFRHKVAGIVAQAVFDQTYNLAIMLMRQRRKELGVSIANLAKRSGVDKSTIRRIFSGDSGVRCSSVKAVAGALGYKIKMEL